MNMHKTLHLKINRTAPKISKLLIGKQRSSIAIVTPTLGKGAKRSTRCVLAPGAGVAEAHRRGDHIERETTNRGLDAPEDRWADG